MFHQPGLETALPAPGPKPALFGIGVGLTLLMGFGLPPVLQLARVPPLRVLRRDVGTPKVASLGVLAGAFYTAAEAARGDRDIPKRGVVAAGATVLLTTQYLEEADQLAQDIVAAVKTQLGAGPADHRDHPGGRERHDRLRAARAGEVTWCST